MTRRYYVSALPRAGGSVSLDHAEAQHAIRVMRVRIGDAIEMFDGEGNQAQAVIVEIGRNRCRCNAQPPERVARELPRAVHLGIALPKPDRARAMIERLTELGVKSITPLVAQRTQRRPSESQMEKLRRAVVESCKQCGRNQLMDVLAAQTSTDFFADRGEETSKLIADCSGHAVNLQQQIASREVIAAIGPEGGWTEQELSAARASGFEPIHLGNRIYRIETAATVVAAWFSLQC